MKTIITHALIAILAAPLANAALITYEFEMVADSTSGNTENIDVGSTMLGYFTIDTDAPTYVSGLNGDFPIVNGFYTDVVVDFNAQIEGYALTNRVADDVFSIVSNNACIGADTCFDGFEIRSGVNGDGFDSAVPTHIFMNWFGPESALDSVDIPLSFDGLSPSTVTLFFGISPSNGIAYFDLVSISQVPVPAAAWFMLSGLGTLLAMARRARR